MIIYHIEAFVALASMLNFTKTSNKLHTSQPNLSKIIVNLEQEIGVQLFTRNRQAVKLTPAGEAFYCEAEKLLAQYHHAINVAQESKAGICGTIKLGFLGTALIDLLPKIVNRFQKQYPAIKLDLKDYTYSLLTEALIHENVDIALIPDRELDKVPQFARKHLFSDSMCAVAHKNHPLMKRTSISITELSQEPFIIMDPKVSIRDYELVTNICLKQNFFPNVIYEANTLNNLILMAKRFQSMYPAVNRSY
ncbi:LysR family transcriptional regulator [Lachnospiraceae bacterium ZAX-1]